jgi:hypothetical protein
VCDKLQSASPPQQYPDTVQLKVRDAQALPQLHAAFPAACLHAELLHPRREPHRTPRRAAACERYLEWRRPQTFTWHQPARLTTSNLIFFMPGSRLAVRGGNGIGAGPQFSSLPFAGCGDGSSVLRDGPLRAPEYLRVRVLSYIKKLDDRFGRFLASRLPSAGATHGICHSRSRY